MRSFRFTSLFAAALALLASVAHGSTIAVTDLSGDVQVTQGGKTSKLAKGAFISSGATLSTGPSATISLAFSNGATFSVGKDTVLSIEEFSQRGGAGIVDPSKLTKEPTASRTILNLRKGQLTGDIKPLNLPAGSVFKIKTPAGPLTIKGTTINLSVQETTNGTYVVNYTIAEGSGLVEPTTVNAVDLGSGQSVTVTIDGDKVVVSNVENLTAAQKAVVQQIVSGLKAALGTTTFNTGATNNSGTFTFQAETQRVTGTEGTAGFKKSE